MTDEPICNCGAPRSTALGSTLHNESCPRWAPITLHKPRYTHDLKQATPELLASLRLETAAGHALDALSPWPRLAGEPDADYRARSLRRVAEIDEAIANGRADRVLARAVAVLAPDRPTKPHLRLRVKLGARTKQPYFAITKPGASLKSVRRWHVTERDAYVSWRIMWD